MSIFPNIKNAYRAKSKGFKSVIRELCTSPTQGLDPHLVIFFFGSILIILTILGMAIYSIISGKDIQSGISEVLVITESILLTGNVIKTGLDNSTLKKIPGLDKFLNNWTQPDTNDNLKQKEQ